MHAPARGNRSWVTAALFAVAILVAFLIYLMLTNYQAQRAVQTRALAEFSRDAGSKAAALGNYLHERRDELFALANSRVVLAFYESRALGVSMEYGLRLSLQSITEALESSVQFKMLERARIYQGMVLVELNGEVLAAAGTPPAVPSAALENVEGGDARVVAAGCNLLVVARVVVAEKCVGHLVAWLDSRVIQDGVLRDLDERDLATNIRTLDGQLCLPRTGVLVGIPDDSWPIVGGEPESRVADGTPLIAVARPVMGSTLTLIHCGARAAILGRGEPEQLLAATAILGLVVLGATLLGVRASASAIVLRERVAASALQQQNMEAANRKLELEVAERRRAEAALQAARARVEAASRAKTEFLANMSHEIRTPMTAILGFVEMLGTQNLATNEAQEALEIIRRNGEHLLELISGILDISKIEAGMLSLECIEFSLPTLLVDLVAPMQARAKGKGVRCELRPTGPLPERVASDPVRLRQILINVVGNAIKFTESGVVTIVPELLDAQSPAPRLRIAITDTGIGIDEDALSHLFTPFAQADSSTTRKYGGTGLGLAISNRLALLLGGELTATSQFGVGSTFCLTIPTGPLAGVRLVELNSTGGHVAEPRNVESPCSQLSGRVLLAEDGPDNQRLISMLIKKAGLDVRVVENGQLAVDEAQQALRNGVPFDLIVMDMQMPVMDGYTATQRLRASGYTRPIVALTAHAMAHERERCLAAGCDDYESKPITRQRLLAMLARHTRPTSSADGRSAAPATAGTGSPA